MNTQHVAVDGGEKTTSCRIVQHVQQVLDIDEDIIWARSP